MAAKILADDHTPCIYAWSSYTNFYLDDNRPVGSIGTSNGQNALYSIVYPLNHCITLGAYGTYEKSKTTNPIIVQSSDILQQGLQSTEGWGCGGNIYYQVFPFLSAYIDYSYIWTRTDNCTLLTNHPTYSSINHSSDGHRWQLSSGLFYGIPIPVLRYLLAGSVYYLYTSSSTGGSIDVNAGNQQITPSNGTLGLGSANGALYFRPLKLFDPFINAGISCDINKTSKPADSISPPLGPVPLVSIPRKPFEWSVGGGVFISKLPLNFAVSYLHRQRKGPITIDSVTLYLSGQF